MIEKFSPIFLIIEVKNTGIQELCGQIVDTVQVNRQSAAQCLVFLCIQCFKAQAMLNIKFQFDNDLTVSKSYLSPG